MGTVEVRGTIIASPEVAATNLDILESESRVRLDQMLVNLTFDENTNELVFEVYDSVPQIELDNMAQAIGFILALTLTETPAPDGEGIIIESTFAYFVPGQTITYRIYDTETRDNILDRTQITIDGTQTATLNFYGIKDNTYTIVYGMDFPPFASGLIEVTI